MKNKNFCRLAERQLILCDMRSRETINQCQIQPILRDMEIQIRNINMEIKIWNIKMEIQIWNMKYGNPNVEYEIW